MFCYSNFKQLSFSDQISELNNLASSNPVTILELLKKHFDLNKFISSSFAHNYYWGISSNGTKTAIDFTLYANV